MTIYSDLENKYQLLDYNITHSQLLIRSVKNKNRAYNIDILFKPASLMLIPAVFYGIEITLCDSDEVIGYLVEKYGFKVGKDYKVFSIKSMNDNVFYINAMAVYVFHNELGQSESSMNGLESCFGEKIVSY